MHYYMTIFPPLMMITEYLGENDCTLITRSEVKVNKGKGFFFVIIIARITERFL